LIKERQKSDSRGYRFLFGGLIAQEQYSEVSIVLRSRWSFALSLQR